MLPILSADERFEEREFYNLRDKRCCRDGDAPYFIRKSEILWIPFAGLRINSFKKN